MEPLITPVAAESEVISWDWDDHGDDGVVKWEKFSPEVSALLEQHFLEGLETLELNEGFFGEQGGYLVNFFEMTQTKNESGHQRQIRRFTGTEPAPLDPAVSYWEWDSSGKWVRYDTESNIVLSEAYEKGLLSFPLVHGYFGSTGGYTIDFTTMSQIRDSSSYARRIRRIPAARRLGNNPLHRPPPRYDGGYVAPKELQLETVRCDPEVARSLRNALALFSRRDGDQPQESPAEDIIVD